LILANLLAPADALAQAQDTVTVCLCAKHTSNTGDNWEGKGQQIEIGAQFWFYGGALLEEIKEGSKKLTVKSSPGAGGTCKKLTFKIDPNQFTQISGAPKRVTDYLLKLWENDCGDDSDYNTSRIRDCDDLIHDKNQTWRGTLYTGCDYGNVTEVVKTSSGGTRHFVADFTGNPFRYYFEGDKAGTKNGTYVVVWVEVY
jgi:hypothetical protein